MAKLIIQNHFFNQDIKKRNEAVKNIVIKGLQHQNKQEAEKNTGDENLFGGQE